LVHQKETNSTVIVVVVSLVVLLCCLCLVLALAAGAGGLLLAGRDSLDELAIPNASDRATEPTQVFPTPIPGLAPDERATEMALVLSDTLVPFADPYDLAARLRGLADVPRVVAEKAAPLELGATQTFWASNVDTDEQFQVDATLAYATEHVYFFVEKGLEADTRGIQSLVNEFESQIYPTDRDFFGSEWTPGVDGDPHLTILYATNLGDSIAGYFGSTDSLNPLIHRYSNSREMFFLNADGQDVADSYALSTLAHEFEHMIQWNQDRNESNWMDEGFAEVAAFLNGYDVGGADMLFAFDTDLPLTYWPPDVDAAHYGQTFMLVAYFLDRFGSEATRALVASQANGLDSMDEVLAQLGEVDPESGAALTADDVVRDWAVAMLLQDPDVAGGRYAYASYPQAPRASPQLEITDCPSGEVQGEVNQYGIDYIHLACRGEYRLSFQGDTLADVVPAEAHSGENMVWSNRGDQSDMSLSRSFDFSGVSGPIELTYWTWYDIEEDWDYVYLLASSDQGATWKILVTPSGTAENPMGNSLGWAYTGYSGGGSESEWIQEAVDLSEYAGQQVLLRFEYVTDAAVNGEGILLDDVSIPAIGYEEGFEVDNGGWDGQGFVRLYNRIPQQYRVLLAVRADDWQIQEIQLDDDRSADVPLVLGDEVRDATLIVIGTTRHTWQMAPYIFEISRP
jgi:immune inhibitor A